MPRAGLTTEHVVATAAELLDAAPADGITLSEVATVLGVKAPSLYNHIDGLDDLLRRLAMSAIAELGDELRTAAMGRTGPDAIGALAAAYRAFAHRRPGMYPLTQHARPHDDEYAALSLRAIEPLEAVLRSTGLDSDDMIHHIRTIRSALHGFVLLEAQGGFGLDVDIDASFDHLVTTLAMAGALYGER